jgi:hypothetical protein
MLLPVKKRTASVILQTTLVNQLEISFVKNDNIWKNCSSGKFKLKLPKNCLMAPGLEITRKSNKLRNEDIYSPFYSFFILFLSRKEH